MKSTPEKHANGVGHQKAVVQNAKERLVVALIWGRKATLSFFFFNSSLAFFI